MMFPSRFFLNDILHVSVKILGVSEEFLVVPEEVLNVVNFFFLGKLLVFLM